MGQKRRKSHFKKKQKQTSQVSWSWWIKPSWSLFFPWKSSWNHSYSGCTCVSKAITPTPFCVVAQSPFWERIVQVKALIASLSLSGHSEHENKWGKYLEKSRAQNNQLKAIYGKYLTFHTSLICHSVWLWLWPCHCRMLWLPRSFFSLTHSLFYSVPTSFPFHF